MRLEIDLSRFIYLYKSSRISFTVYSKIFTIYSIYHWLSLNRGFGGCGHGFNGCDGLGGLGGFGGFDELGGFCRFDGFSRFRGFDGFSGFDGWPRLSLKGFSVSFTLLLKVLTVWST